MKRKKDIQEVSRGRILSNALVIDTVQYLGGDDTDSASDAQCLVVTGTIGSIARHLEPGLHDIDWVADIEIGQRVGLQKTRSPDSTIH
jgi:hypothetical protein